MSNTSQFQKTSTRTTNITDSYNATNTVNRVFDNTGNTEVYINSDKGEAGGTGMNRNVIIAAAVVGAALLFGGKD